MQQRNSELLKHIPRLSRNFSLYRKIILFFSSMTQNFFGMVKKFLDNSATLLQRFFSLWWRPEAKSKIMPIDLIYYTE